MKNLNFNSMSKTMSFLDKAKIIFASMCRASDTEGKDHIITPQEKEKMTESMSADEVSELNRIGKLYNCGNLATSDIEHATRLLFLAMGQIDLFVVTMNQFSSHEDLMEKLSCFLEGSKDKEAKRVMKIIEEEQESYAGHSEMFGRFTIAGKKKNEKPEPNRMFQCLFARAIEYYKLLKQTIYSMEWLLKKTKVDIMNETNKQVLKEGWEQLQAFEEQKGFVCYADFYVSFMEEEDIRDKNFSESLFLDYLKDRDAVLALSDEEKKEIEKRAKKVLKEE